VLADNVVSGVAWSRKSGNRLSVAVLLVFFFFFFFFLIRGGAAVQLRRAPSTFHYSRISTCLSVRGPAQQQQQQQMPHRMTSACAATAQPEHDVVFAYSAPVLPHQSPPRPTRSSPRPTRQSTRCPRTTSASTAVAQPSLRFNSVSYVDSFSRCGRLTTDSVFSRCSKVAFIVHDTSSRARSDCKPGCRL
jgi:hypothetical protein